MANSKKTQPVGLIVAGTNTEVGKTQVACAIVSALVEEGARVGVYKPAASGAVERDGRQVWEDAERLWEAAGRPLDRDAVCPQRFNAPLAPHLAARAEGRELDTTLLRTGLNRWRNENWDVVVVEGAGGLLSPISDRDLVADLALDIGWPVLLVVPNALGVIGQTLNAVIAAHCYKPDMEVLSDRSPRADAGQRGLKLAGIVLNQASQPDPHDESLDSNRKELERLCTVPVLSEMAFGASQLGEPVDWRTLLGGAW